MVVFGVDHGVEGFVAAAFDAAGFDQAGVDAVGEFCDYDQVVGGGGVGLGLFGGVCFYEVGDALIVGVFDVLDAPESGVCWGGVAAGGQDTDFVAALDTACGEFNGFGLVGFEDQAEGAAVGEVTDFGFEVLGESCISLSQLP